MAKSIEDEIVEAFRPVHEAARAFQAEFDALKARVAALEALHPQGRPVHDRWPACVRCGSPLGSYGCLAKLEDDGEYRHTLGWCAPRRAGYG